ncbi:competence/damage-inducible protein A [Halocatena halophila]|uniref:competence/damage-inducible protein A n=1 Tax=Halocatena halophila TaxID=2814576 RepID=UPI002ED32F24
MNVGIVTVGNELLSGETENTNASWLATQLTDRGVSVGRITVVPDEVATIADTVDWFTNRFDATIVTGGLGGTPDDLTMAAVAETFEQPLVPNERARENVTAAIRSYQAENSDAAISIDIESEASIPKGARVLLNEPGLSPGCVLESVYVLPGIPSEMRSMFASVAHEFSGERRTRTVYTTDPESQLIETLEAVTDSFAVSVGCYPDDAAGHNRLTLTGTNSAELTDAVAWLSERVELTSDSHQ